MGTGPTARHGAGFTLIEIVITLAVAAIVLATAVPSFSAMLEKQQLDGVQARLLSDVHFARAESALRGERIVFSVQGTLGGCYLMHIGPTAACTCSDAGQASCTGGATVVKVVGLGSTGTLRLRANKAAVLDPLHGTVTPNPTLTLTAASGRSVRTIFSTAGRVRTCSPVTGAPAVPGYPVC